ncbi:MAG: lysophospholipid acyltransferase family protein [Actinomycetota bacterium]
MLYRFWWFTLGPLIRLYWRLGVHDRHKTRGLGGLIIASNHQSGIDPVLVCMSFWRHVYWLAKIELVITKKVSWFFKSASVIPVDRGAPGDDALVAAAEVVKRGEIFGIFPEGTRGPDERVYRGHTGVARVAHLSGGAVIPTAVFGSARACPKGKVMIRPVRCDVVYGDPMYFAIRPGESQASAYRRFTNEVMEAIAELAGTTYVCEVYSSDARREHQRLAS